MSRHLVTPRTLLALALAAAVPLAARAAPSRDAEGTTAHRHTASGVSCADCHGASPARAPVAAARCLSCHGPAAALVAKTSSRRPVNPHDSPHWGADIECGVCHRQHEPTVNWCAHCHASDLKVP